MKNAALSLHGAQRITVSRHEFNGFTTTRLTVIYDDKSKMEIDVFAESALAIEDLGTEDHRMVAT